MNRNLIISGLLLVFGLVGYWGLLSVKKNNSPRSAGRPSALDQSNQDAVLKSDLSQKGEMQEGLAQGASDSREAFVAWLAQESRSLDHSQNNTSEKQAEIAQVAERLTPVQADYLLETALNESAPAGQRILATYLLVQGRDRSQRQLAAFVAAPLKDHGLPEAHSHAESQSVREKSLRIMAVDGWLSQAENDDRIRRALVQAIEHIQDPYIKDYVAKKVHLFR